MELLLLTSVSKNRFDNTKNKSACVYIENIIASLKDSLLILRLFNDDLVSFNHIHSFVGTLHDDR
jgi:hypothetical protein